MPKVKDANLKTHSKKNAKNVIALQLKSGGNGKL